MFDCYTTKNERDSLYFDTTYIEFCILYIWVKNGLDSEVKVELGKNLCSSPGEILVMPTKVEFDKKRRFIKTYIYIHVY